MTEEKTEAAGQVSSIQVNPLPSVGDLVFIGVCQLLLFMRPSLIFSDGSTGWHLVAGQYILEHFAVPSRDLFSYTFPNKAWVAYEWLWDALAALCTRFGGLEFLAVAVSVSLATLVLLLYQRMRRAGTPFLIALFFSIIGLLASANHWLVRPHLCTFFGVYGFYSLLEDYYRRQLRFPKLAICLALLMLVWVNAHPAFLLGFVILAIYFGASLLRAVLNGGAAKDGSNGTGYWSDVLKLGCLGLGLGLLIFINPYGGALFHYIAEYLKGSSILAQTNEFQSPNFHDNIHALCLEILFASLIAGFYLNGSAVSLPSVFALIVFGALSLSAVRNIPLFVLICLPNLGYLYAGENKLYAGLRRLFPARLAQSVREFGLTEAGSTRHFLSVIYALVLLVMAAMNLKGDQGPLFKANFDEQTMPTATLQFIQKNKLVAQEGFSLDNWGGLINYKLKMPVFIDDRADFYGEDFYHEYGRVCEVRSGWQQILDQDKINWVLFPKESELVKALKAAGWKVVCEDAASALLLRPGK